MMRAYRLAALPILAALVVALLLVGAPPPQVQAQERRCFTETGQCIEGRFLEYWEQNGGLPVFGFPTTAPAEEINHDLGRPFLTQWFERARLELHPENSRPYDVLLGRLGSDVLRKSGIDWQTQPVASGPQSGCLWFETTRHNVCDQQAGVGFMTYWRSHGLEFDGRPGVSYEESLALFGMPLSEPRTETNVNGDTVLTQWFERARFEWHPQNPAPYKVLLGLLGHEARIPIVRSLNQGLSGRLLVYADRLYSVSADGRQLVPLLNRSDMDAGFVVSPDGRRLAGRCFHQNASGLCVMDVDGNNVRRLNNDPTSVPSSWSPDGTRLIYISSEGDRRGIYVTNVDGSGERMLMAGTSGRMLRGGTWSPDGSRIAFQTIYSEEAIYVVNSDGSELRKIVEHGSNPLWSPDGSRIAFTVQDQSDSDIYLVNPDGTNLTPLLNSADPELSLRWSPDGSRIAYILARPGDAVPGGRTPVSVIVMRADGSGKTTVMTEDGGGLLGGLTWSPDGAYLAANIVCPRLGCPDHIRVGAVDGSRVFRVMEAEQAGKLLALVKWLP